MDNNDGEAEKGDKGDFNSMLSIAVDCNFVCETKLFSYLHALENLPSRTINGTVEPNTHNQLGQGPSLPTP